MTKTVEIYLYSKGEMRDRRLPAEWQDPENITHVPEHHWRYLVHNPLSRDDGDPVRAYVLVDKQVAGRVGLMPGEISVEGKPMEMLWGFDLWVSKRFRGRGLAIKLIRAWRDAHHTTFGLHVNAESLGIYHKLDWSEMHVSNLFLIHRSRKFVEGYLPGPLGAVLAPLVDAGLALRRGAGRLGGGGVRPGLRTERISSMPEELDAELGRPLAPITTHRSAAWVNWALDAANEMPGVECRLFRLLSGDKPVGYFILHLKQVELMSHRFKDLKIGSVRDWRIFDESRADMASLVVLACKESRAWGAAATLATVPDPRTVRTLRRWGFRNMRPLHALYHAVPPSPLTDEKYRDVRNWHFTTADDDGLLI